MKRIWQVQEQTIEDASTKLRLEFSSVHTDELNAGNEPPAHDELVILRLWTSARDRVASFLFERNGRFVRCEVEPVNLPEPVLPPSESPVDEPVHLDADPDLALRLASPPAAARP